MNTKLYPCCPHCPDDPDWHADHAPDTHDGDCPTCEHERIIAPVRDQLTRERDEARAELAAARADLYVILAAITGQPADHLHVRNGWIVAEAGGCTCYGGGPYGHEPGCGYEPIVQLTDLTPERRNAREDAVAEASYRTGQLDAGLAGGAS